MEHLGNKLPLEKKLNISASNNYFDKKKEKYRESNIAICKKLGLSSLAEWNLANIDNNDVKVCAMLKETFQKWIDDYEPVAQPEANQTLATEEELALIQSFRERGLI